MLAHRLAHLLSAFLVHTVVVTKVNVVDGDALSCEIQSSARPGSGLQWWGVVGFDTFEGARHTSATLLLFSHGHRFTVQGMTSSTLELVLQRTPGGDAQWVSEGWKEDEFGEWDTITTLPDDTGCR